MYITLHLKDLNTIKTAALCDRYLVRIKFIPDFQQYTRSRRVEITFYENTPVMLRNEPEGDGQFIIKKSFLILFFISSDWINFHVRFPIVIMIKMDSAGPVFFKQQRSGRGMILSF
jgi:undecaprenyl-phosphate galactose phosphotransferase/putative colanic acid biosynthesis UDP-glucose lipid carrier transferase